jgi:hypothetical protein
MTVHPNNFIEASLSAGRPGEITKDLLQRTEVICAGRVQAVHHEEEGTVNVAGQSITGNWQVADFVIDHLIKGEMAAKRIQVRYFVPRDSVRGIHFDVLPEERRCILFLVPMAEQESTYALVNRTASVIPLSSNLPYGVEANAVQSEHIKRELLEAIATEEIWIAVAALRSLAQIGLTDDEVIGILKTALTGEDKAVTGTVLAMRISLMDKTALPQARVFVESGVCPETQYKEIGAALRQLTAPHFFLDLQKMLQSPSVFLRRGASYALRYADSGVVVPIFISVLEDKDQEVRYNAVAGLASFTSKTGKWFPAYSAFIKNESFYVELWRNWWETEGENRYEKIKESQNNSSNTKESIV